MPRYNWKCGSCGAEGVYWARMNERERGCSCGGVMSRLFSPPTSIICDYEPYFDENLTPVGSSSPGTWVMSRQHRRELLKQFGLYERG